MDLSKISGKKFKPSPKQEEPLPEFIIPKDKQTLKRVFKLAGTTFTNYNFETLTKQQPVKLVLDPLGSKTQPHNDPTAIAVFDELNQHIAYIPRDQAKHIYPMLESNTLKSESYVFSVKGGEDTYNWGVEILVLFTEL